MKNKFLLIFCIIFMLIGSLSVYGGLLDLLGFTNNENISKPIKIDYMKIIKDYKILEPTLNIDIATNKYNKATTEETDIIFNKLTYNNIKGNDASFEMNIDTIKTDNIVSFMFNEVCGKVNDYKLYEIVSCMKNITTYTYKTKEICINNKTITSCYNEYIIDKTIITPTQTTCENEVPKNYQFSNGGKNVKIVSDIQDEICSDGYVGHKIDWIPLIKGLNSNIYIQDKWDWWNVSGGITTTILDNGINYTIHKFLINGTFITPINLTNVTILIVGAGGVGGMGTGARAGGGGAGGVIYNNTYIINNGSYSVIVGDTTYATTSDGTIAQNSSFNGLIARGGGAGGGGAGGPYPGTTAGYNGSSGGGGATRAGAGAIGLGTAGQGNNGGLGLEASPAYGAGGGGGSGTVGVNGISTAGGNGGNGTFYNITGTSICYAGGGGGASGGISYAVGTGMCGGGNGTASTATFRPGNGTANTGSGGGGGSDATPDSDKGGNGGSGVVIIRYATDLTFNGLLQLNNIPNTNISFLQNLTIQTNCTYINGTAANFTYLTSNNIININNSGYIFDRPLLNETGNYFISITCLLSTNNSINITKDFTYTIHNNINNFTTYIVSNTSALFGTYTNFILNISNLYNLNYTTTIFSYNGTNYSTPTKTEYINYTIFNQSILNNIDLGNFTYYWSIIGNQPISTGGSFIYNTNITNHSVKNISNVTVNVINYFSSTPLTNFKVYVNNINVCNASISEYGCSYTPTNLSNMTVLIEKSNYSNYTVLTNFKTFNYLSNVTYSMYPFTTFNFLDETTFSPFQMNSTIGIVLKIKCPLADYYYTINVSTGASNIFTVPLVCTFTDFTVDVNYGAVSYIRNLIYPNTILDFVDINIYLMQINNAIPGYVNAVNVDFILDDTLSQYPNPSLIIGKYINTTFVQISGGRVETVSGKVTTFLIQNDAYKIQLYSEDVFVKELGSYTASASGVVPIRLYDILFGASPNGFSSDVSYIIISDNTTYPGSKYVVGNYNDTSLETSKVIFTVYQESLSGTVLNTQMSTANNVQFIFNITPYTASNLVCMLNMTSQGTNIIYTRTCNDATNINVDMLSFVNPQIINWFFIVIISVLALYATVRTANIMALIIVGMSALFTYFGWLNIGRGLLAVALLVAFINYLSDRNKEQ